MSCVHASDIFEQAQPLSAVASTGELYLIKEGVCSIRQRVVLDIQQPDEKTSLPADTTNGASSSARRIKRPVPTKPAESATMRVMVTVADVSDGHVFWFDGDAFPFTLQAVSASVTISTISIDKLRAIVPRTQLAALERVKNQMSAFYTAQFTMAKRAVVALLNEKRAAQMGALPNPTFLPSVNLHSPFKVVPRAPASSSRVTSDGVTGSSDPSIPFSRLLISRPVDLVELHADHERAKQLEEQQAEDEFRSSSVRGYARAWRGGDNGADTAYRRQHAFEHYELDHGLPNATLVGSFPDNAELRRRRRSDLRTDVLRPDALNDPLASPKAEECMQPEAVTPYHSTPASATANQLSDSANHVHLEVKVPVFHDPRAPTPPPSSSQPGSRGPIAASLLCPKTPRSPRTYTPAFDATDSDIGLDLEIDLREFLRAQMTAVDAPMRTLKLAPSLTKANALGQYLTLSPSPRQQSTAPLEHDPPAGRASKVLLPKSWTPFRILSRHLKAADATKTTPLVPVTNAQLSSLNQVGEQAPVRKQGFLCVAVLLGPSDAALPSRLPRGRRRRYFALVDNVLLEFAENVDVALVRASCTPASCTHRLDEQAAGSSVMDVPVASAPESEKAALRMSFALAVDSTMRLLLTAESATEKKIWMHELRLACSLGARAAPMHQKVQATRLAAPTLVPGATNAEAHTPSRGSPPSRGGRLHNTVDSDLVLEVEYRIS